MKEMEQDKLSTSYDHERKPCGCELKVGSLPCNLHASAQELLDALKCVTKELKNWTGEREATKIGEQAIAKAEK